MTVKEAIEKWSEAATVTKAGKVLVRDGNWSSTARALRHFTDDGAAEVTESDDTLNGDTVIVVTPHNEKDAPPSPRNRAPFLLVVK
jgi:hypothetical protein